MEECGPELGWVLGYCGHGSETLVSIQGRAFFDYLRELLVYENGCSMDVIVCNIVKKAFGCYIFRRFN
jgi:hypothetical protein